MSAVIGADLSVHVGRDGWLFLDRWENLFSLQSSRDLDLWREQGAPFFALMFASRARRCADKGVPFIGMVAPEKATIYPDRLDPAIERGETSVAQALAEACQSEGVNFLDVSPALRRARGAMDVYAQTDTHWSFYGAWVAYNALMDAVEEHLPVARMPSSDVTFTHKRLPGDLGVHFDPIRKGWTQTVEISSPEPTLETLTWDERSMSYKEWRYESGSGVALLIGDSFSTFLTPYLARTFRRLVFASPSTTLLDDMVDDVKPDIVIFQIAERALFAGGDPLSDWPSVEWTELYCQSRDEQAGFALNRSARLAYRQGRFDEAIQLARDACAEAGDGRYATTLACALVAAADWRGALEVCRHAKLANRRSRGLAFCAFRAFEGLGDCDKARACLEAALALQPRNARYRYELGKLLHRIGDRDGAVHNLHCAIESAPAHWDSISLLHKILYGNGVTKGRNQ
jgi:tetratricopeptide (TPR) repeat protein